MEVDVGVGIWDFVRGLCENLFAEKGETLMG